LTALEKKRKRGGCAIIPQEKEDAFLVPAKLLGKKKRDQTPIDGQDAKGTLKLQGRRKKTVFRLQERGKLLGENTRVV